MLSKLSKNFPPDFSEKRPIASKAKGIFIYDDDGKKYLDGCCGAMTSNLGHGVDEVIESMKEQLDIITFTHRHQFSNAPLEELCNRIASVAPKGLNVVSLVNSGSEANEMAVRMAYDYWCRNGGERKKRILGRWPSYHGGTFGTLSFSGIRNRRVPYNEYLDDYPVLETAFCHRCPYKLKYPECGVFCASYLQTVINRSGAETISAVICEPITGAAGAGITPPDEYFPMIREICTKNNILLIFDEVITGFGRTGKYFACEHWGVKPDIITFAKGASSGYGPTAGIIIDEKIYDTIAENPGSFFLTGHTFSGNPLCAAGATAVLQYIEKNNVVDGVAKKGAYLKEKLDYLYDKYEIVTDVRGKGLLWGLELSKNKETLEVFNKEQEVTKKLVRIAFENGLIVYPSQGFIDGITGDSILISPSLLITENEIDQMISLLDKSIETLQKSLL